MDDELERTLPENYQSAIQDEFKKVLRLLEFDTKPYEIFRTWYRDGRLYYHKIVTPGQEAEGIQELRYLDPRKIRKAREHYRKRADKTTGQTVSLHKVASEYFLYSTKGFAKGNRALNDPSVEKAGGDDNVFRIAKDSILHCTSGLLDAGNKMVLSYLHKAMRPMNQLRAMEDATVIYRIARAPERRVFYIDVGSLPKAKAEQHLKDMMTKFKNRLVYDASTGEIRDDRRFLTMLEDFWLPRREGGRGTEISTLPGGQNLGEMADVEYFQGKLLKSLNVPISRMNPETMYNVGRATEITRDEVKFSKFIDRLRLKFSELFLDALETQLILKGILTPEEWDEIRYKLRFKFLHDNYFAELKESEILMERFNRLMAADPFAGKYFSHNWIRTHILRQSEDEKEELDVEMEQELQMPQYNQAPAIEPPPEMGPIMNPQPQPIAAGDDEYANNDIDDVLKEELVNMLRKDNGKDDH
jgi:hypothetical protein